MSGTTSFEPNTMRQEANRVEHPRADEAAGAAPAGDSTGHGGGRSSFLQPPTRSSVRAPASTIEKPAVEAAGAVDAKNASTAPWKTAKDAVSHSYHKPLLFPSVTQSVTHVPG